MDLTGSWGNLKIKKLLLLSLRVLLGAVFVVSGFQKLISPYQNFAAVVEKFELLKGPALSLFAQALPWAEFVAGVFFVLGFWENISLFILWGMNAAFIGVLISALARKLPLDSCGCFGDAMKLSLPQMLSLDIFLCSMFLLYFSARRRHNPPGLDQIAWR